MRIYNPSICRSTTIAGSVMLSVRTGKYYLLIRSGDKYLEREI